MRFWVTVRKLNVTDRQTDRRTDRRTGGVAISPVPGLREIKMPNKRVNIGVSVDDRFYCRQGEVYYTQTSSCTSCTSCMCTFLKNSQLQCTSDIELWAQPLLTCHNTTVHIVNIHIAYLMNAWNTNRRPCRSIDHSDNLNTQRMFPKNKITVLTRSFFFI